MTDRLRFGTAGLRAALGDGPMRMNVQIVELAAKAIATWLPPASVVIIGRDARYGSEDFAKVTARVLAEAGHQPQLFPEPVPTPIVAYAVSATAAAGGVMVTASHNPATDNGYKVYAGDGSQILPDDAEIIEAEMASLPWPGDVSIALPDSVVVLKDDLIDAYLNVISEFVQPEVSNTAPDLHRSGISIAYTAMHGVGGDLFVRALERAGHELHSVPEQHHPDPDFPTAAFPNPEEPGTMDLVMALATEVQASVVLANDPDADRLAVAVLRDGGWERLTGDQIGVLLGWYVIGRTEGPRAVATTIVSSSLLSKVAAAVDVACHHTLTGFKWLLQTDTDDLPLIFAYEEALGYSVYPSIRDKDGISAGLMFAELVSQIASFGHTIDDVLENLASEHGHHLTSQVSSRFEGDDPMAQMTKRMAELRANPPGKLGGVVVDEIVDLLDGTAHLPASDVLIYRGGGVRLIIRPSGTEPKIKAYIEVVAKDLAEAQKHQVEVEAMIPDLLR